MIPLLVLAAASADLDALDQAVTKCDRHVANPAFSGEAARHSQFLLDTFREQETLVNARLALTNQRRALREPAAGSAPLKLADQKQLERQLDLQQADLDDRQKALNDQRMLEGIREDAMDAMRRYFLNNCPAGVNEKSK